MNTSSTAVICIDERSRRDYQCALLRLNKVIGDSVSSRLRQVAFPEFHGDIPLTAGLDQLEEGIEQLITLVNGTTQTSNLTTTQKVKYTVKRWFQSSYPFAQLFLTIAKEGANV